MPSEVSFEPAAGDIVTPPPIAPGKVHLWSAGLVVGGECRRVLATSLSAQERRRRDRYRIERHRHRFEVTWGFTRALLAAYAGEPAHQLSFDFGPKGKPFLRGEAARYHFNLSHSGDLVVLAVTTDGPLGVDIEELRLLEDASDIARRYFSVNEIRELEGLDATRHLEGFFNCWTRKEALIKAVGEGLFVSLDRFDVSLVPGQPARLVSLDGETLDATTAASSPWHLTHLRPTPQMVGALATGSPPEAVDAWELDLDRQAIAG